MYVLYLFVMYTAKHSHMLLDVEGRYTEWRL